MQEDKYLHIEKYKHISWFVIILVIPLKMAMLEIRYWLW
jgi:hypothetical protein